MKRNASPDRTPWTDPGLDGEDLVVHDFLTTRLSALMGSLRRQVTMPYASSHGLSIAEWRVLSLVAHAGILPFGYIVTQSASDKAQVSRVVRQLERRGLLATQPSSDSPRKKIDCLITPAGKTLHDRVIVVARKRQAQVISILAPTEREALFAIIEKLQASLENDR